MPYTPHFSVSQTAENIVVSIRVPHIRISDAEISVDGRDFTFWCKPYLLNLQLPGDLKADDDDSCGAKYLPDENDGTIVATILKLNNGEHFEGLDLITTLLRPSTLSVQQPLDTSSSSSSSSSSSTLLSNPNPTPLIEVISSSENLNNDNSLIEELPPPPPPSQQQQQQQPSINEIAHDIGSLQLDTTRRYGFNQQYTGVFRNLHDEMVDIFDESLNPEQDLASTRSQCREAVEEADFDAERYLGDEYLGIQDDMLYLSAKDFVPFWCYEQPSPTVVPNNEEVEDDDTIPSIITVATPPSSSSPSPAVLSSSSETRGFIWTDSEVSQLQKLPNKEYLMDETENLAALSNLVSILIGYAYDQRMTCGEGSVETPWTIAKLSASLSWLDHFNGPRGAEQAVLSGVRRILCYPYFRSHTLAKLVVSDVLEIFRRGRRVLLRCCLQIHANFQRANDHQGYYLLNKIFITDYLIWLQKVRTETITGFTEGSLKRAHELVCTESLGKAALGVEFGALIIQLDERAQAYYDDEEEEDN